MYKYKKAIVILAIIAFQSIKTQAQWNISSSYESLILSDSYTELRTLHTIEERIFISFYKPDLTYEIFYSDDGGTNWLKSESDNKTAGYNLLASSGDTLYSFGKGFFGNYALRKSIDNGATWIESSTNTSNFPFAFAPTNFSAIGNTLIVTGTTRNNGLMKSINGGASWESFAVFSDNDSNKSISGLFSTDSTFYMSSSTNGRGLYSSHVDSARWVKTHEVTGSVHDALNDTNGRLYYLGESGIDYSDNKGTTWETKLYSELGIASTGVLTGFELMGDSLIITNATNSGPSVFIVEKNLESPADIINEGLAGYDNATRIVNFKTTSKNAFAYRANIDSTLWVYGDQSTKVSTEEVFDVEKFQLSQNYPNPFNPSTNIKFNVPQASEVSLKVYNMLGQEVATLVNERMSSGLQTVKFDASNLSSGMYIYRLQAGNISKTKKMMLIK